jgi:hypothetical protein
LSWFAIARSVDEGLRGHFEKLQYEAIPFAVDEFSRACLPGWEKASLGFDGPKWNLTRSICIVNKTSERLHATKKSTVRQSRVQFVRRELAANSTADSADRRRFNSCRVAKRQVLRMDLSAARPVIGIVLT